MNARHLTAVFVAATTFAGTLAQAQTAWPSKPIRWIVPFPPGGPADVVTRLLSAKLAERVDRRRVTTSAGPPGGNGTIQRIGFDGHAVCACASVPANVVAATKTAVRCLAFMPLNAGAEGEAAEERSWERPVQRRSGGRTLEPCGPLHTCTGCRRSRNAAGARTRKFLRRLRPPLSRREVRHRLPLPRRCVRRARRLQPLLLRYRPPRSSRRCRRPRPKPMRPRPARRRIGGTRRRRSGTGRSSFQCLATPSRWGPWACSRTRPTGAL